MIHFDALDISECNSEEVMFLLMLSVYKSACHWQIILASMLTILPPPDSNGVVLVNADSEQVLARGAEVDRAHTSSVETPYDGQRLFRLCIPDVDRRCLTNLTGGYDVGELGVVVDGQADDIICVLKVEALAAWWGKENHWEKSALLIFSTSIWKLMEKNCSSLEGVMNSFAGTRNSRLALS